MMTPQDLSNHLSQLGITQTEAARLLSVNARTMRRWLEGEEVPGPAEQAIRAWLRLHRRNLPWRPDSIAIVEDDQDQIAAHRAHAIQLDAILARVEARGGARLPWQVDRVGRRAVLGPMEVSFYTLANGSFSLASYTRKDGDPNVQRDWEFIEDAAFCIAKELRKEAAIPATLWYVNRPLFVGAGGHTATVLFEEFQTTLAAVDRACTLMGSPNFRSPHVKAGTRDSSGEIIWDELELRQECARRKKSQAA
ncbi:MAG TPA: hypothetical protein VGX95_01245 [Xanthobacteraceae bacterium]|jgi:hypothetical protein|nr:hypothetical protein [Xanthobacteraceae bacterium]